MKIPLTRLSLVLSSCVALLTHAAAGSETKPIVRVGANDGDLRGSDHRVIQAAVDYVANLGGGTVEVLPGRYTLRDAIRLRTGVTLRGTPEQTVLKLQGGGRTLLARDVKKGETVITVSEDHGLKVGDGMFLQDSDGHGFQVTTATLVAQVGPREFRLSQPAESDYLLSRMATARRGISGIGGWKIADARVEGFAVEGSWGDTPSEHLGGCRGGGIYLFGCKNVTVRDCSVRRFDGDAISFQGECEAVTVEQCLCERNANVGLHPGSYSHSCIVRNNTVRKNGYVGLFVCVGVRKTLFEANTIVDNQGCGVSIGFDDSDNHFVRNLIENNAETGVLFRRDSPKAEHGAHRNVFERNVVRDNLAPRPAKSNSRPGSASRAAVVIEGPHHQLVFRNNVFEFSKPHPGAAILHDAVAEPLQLENNRLGNLTTKTLVHSED